MTREESKAKLVQLRADAEALTKEYNEAIQNGKFDVAQKKDEAIEQKVNEYTGIVRDMCFDDCKATSNPMLTAVQMLFFTTIATKDEKKGDDKVPVRSIVDKDKPIDLLKLDKHCGGIGADKNWAHIAQKMNFLLTVQKCHDLGIDPKEVNDSYAMSEIARQFEFGKNPTSNTQLLKSLQTVITAMLGDEYKATSHDVAFLLSVYSKKNRAALTVTCANHRYMRNYLAEICHRIVTNGAYKVDFKRKRDNITGGSPVEKSTDKPKSGKSKATPAPKPEKAKKERKSRSKKAAVAA